MLGFAILKEDGTTKEGCCIKCLQHKGEEEESEVFTELLKKIKKQNSTQVDKNPLT